MDTARRHLGLVFVHGAGKEPSGYFRGFLSALAADLGAEPPYLSAWWADLCDVGPAVKGGAAAPPRLTQEAEAFRHAYLQSLGLGTDGQLEQGNGQGRGHGRGRAKNDAQSPVRSVGGTLISLTDTVNDIVQYFYNRSLRSAIQARLQDRLAEATASFDHTLLVSHSLGTVIAYDVLRQKANAYNVHTWFTTGSPLARLAQLGQVTREVGQIGGEGITAWQNVYDLGDVVASALGSAFSFPLKDLVVENGAGILNSHNYWGNRAVASLVADAVKRRYMRLPL